MVEPRAVVQHQGGQGVTVMPLNDFGQIEVGEDIGIYRQKRGILQGSGQGAQAAAGAEDRRLGADQDREPGGCRGFEECLHLVPQVVGVHCHPGGAGIPELGQDHPQ